MARTGSWQEQAVSTYRLAAQAVAEGRFAEAASLGQLTIDEAREGHEFFPLFVERARIYLRRAGVALGVLAEEEARILSLLSFPDGSAFAVERGWTDYTNAIAAFGRACEERRADDAHRLLEQAREAWRATHDRACDWVCGLIDIGARYLGEDRVVDLWDDLMGPFYESRDRYDVDRTPWAKSFERLMLDTLETFRGHLSGPARAGDLEVIEERDRWIFRLDPCGSGGRTYRYDPEGGPPRMLPPYNFAVTEAPHDWSWQKKGVCLYCVHCCQLQERIPIEKFGYPVRVIDPPTWPTGEAGAKCTWSVYKDPALIPAEAYERVGARKPDRLGSRAREALDAPAS